MQQFKQKIGLALVVLVAGGFVQAEIYKWEDESGKVHFGDSPPEAVKTEQLRVEVNSISMPTVTPADFFAARETRQQAHESRQVVMYSTQRCGFCKKARRYFRQQGIPFKEYDVEKSRKGKADYKKMNGRGVPIILVGSSRMNGFSVKRFQQFYDGAVRR